MPFAECWTCDKEITLKQMPYCEGCKSKQKKGTLELWL
jgi:Zn finger protein HypA/HybF involved in hydrogenase expression